MQFNRFQTLADIFILTGLLIFGGIVFGFLGILICVPIFHLDIATLQSAILDAANPANSNLLKIFNLFTTFGTWVASAFVFIKYRHYSVGAVWQLKLPKPIHLLWFLPLVSVSLLFISSFLINVNAAIPLPESIRNFTSAANQKVLENMLIMDNVNQLFINILVIGLAPALFEEIFFRGTLQRLMIHLFDNAPIGIFLTSFVFAAIHLNAMQFIPMLFLALVLGYICYYTKSIWPGIILHFLNNSSAVLVNYFEDKSGIAKELADDSYNPPVIFILLAFILVGVFFYWIINFNQKETLNNNE